MKCCLTVEVEQCMVYLITIWAKIANIEQTDHDGLRIILLHVYFLSNKKISFPMFRSDT